MLYLYILNLKLKIIEFEYHQILIIFIYLLLPFKNTESKAHFSVSNISGTCDTMGYWCIAFKTVIFTDKIKLKKEKKNIRALEFRLPKKGKLRQEKKVHMKVIESREKKKETQNTTKKPKTTKPRMLFPGKIIIQN